MHTKYVFLLYFMSLSPQNTKKHERIRENKIKKRGTNLTIGIKLINSLDFLFISRHRLWLKFYQASNFEKKTFKFSFPKSNLKLILIQSPNLKDIYKKNKNKKNLVGEFIKLSTPNWLRIPISKLPSPYIYGMASLRQWLRFLWICGDTKLVLQVLQRFSKARTPQDSQRRQGTTTIFNEDGSFSPCAGYGFFGMANTRNMCSKC